MTKLRMMMMMMMMMMTKLRMLMRGKGGMCVCGWMRSIKIMAGRVRVGTDGERSGREWSVLTCLADFVVCAEALLVT